MGSASPSADNQSDNHDKSAQEDVEMGDVTKQPSMKDKTRQRATRLADQIIQSAFEYQDKLEQIDSSDPASEDKVKQLKQLYEKEQERLNEMKRSLLPVLRLCKITDIFEEEILPATTL